MISVFHLNIKIVTGRTGNNGTKNVEMWVPRKYQSSICRTLVIGLINCEINLVLTWYTNFILSVLMMAKYQNLQKLIQNFMFQP